MITQERKEQKKQWYLKNKEHILKLKKEHYLINKESINESQKEYKKKYYLKNKEYCLNYAKTQGKKYYLKNKEYIIERNRKYKNLKVKNDPYFRMQKNLRARVYSALKGKGKSASTMELLGCSIDKLWNHLESKFESWMTKENYGLWHVDHKIACASFDLTCPVQQLACFHYTNLQPLSATDNKRKGAR